MTKKRGQWREYPGVMIPVIYGAPIARPTSCRNVPWPIEKDSQKVPHLLSFFQLSHPGNGNRADSSRPLVGSAAVRCQVAGHGAERQALGRVIPKGGMA